MNTKLSDSIISIVESFLPVGTKDKVLVLAIDARVHFYFKTKEISAIRGIHIAIYRPDNYTKVIMAIEDKDLPSFIFNKDLPFVFKSDHDSCWRDDGLSSPLFKVTHEMVKELEEKGAKRLPFDRYSWFTYICGMKILPGKIEVDRDKDYAVKLILS